MGYVLEHKKIDLYTVRMNTNYITDPESANKQPFKYFWILGMVWVTFLLIGTPVALKTFTIGSWEYTVSIIAYPVTYIFTDIFTEVYGYRNSRKMVWTGFICLLIASVFWYMYAIVPPSPNFAYNDAFVMIFKSVPQLLMIGFAAFISGEFINSIILAKLKVRTKGKLSEVRYITSTLFGQLVDNTIFFTGVYFVAGFYTADSIVTLIASSVVFCTLVELCMTPVTKRVVGFLKRKEGIDVYDTNTRFTIL